jgi:hypothetical protein
MRRIAFLLSHVTVAVLGTAAFWWFVLPDAPAEAIADGITAAAIAGWVEIMAAKLG